MSEIQSHAFLALVSGFLSVLSPCVLPLMPAYLSLISGISVEEMQEGASAAGMRRRVMGACLAFVLGFTAVFVVMGVGAVAAGHVLRTWQVEVFGVGIGAAQIAGAVVILLGLPSLALPTHVASGLPIGVQIVGPMHDDDAILDMGLQLERELGRVLDQMPERFRL